MRPSATDLIRWLLYGEAGVAAAIVAWRLGGSHIPTLLASSSAPAWAQAIGATVAVAVAIVVPARQESRRLREARDRRFEVRSVVARHTGGIDVSIMYTPEVWHARVHARVRLLEPTDGALIPMIEGDSRAGFRPRATDLHGTAAGSDLLIDMPPASEQPEPVLQGWVHCNRYDNGELVSAKLRIVLLQDGLKAPLIERVLTVSAVDR